MATADEILLAAGEEQGVQPDVLVVDNDLRTITIPESLKILGVEGDDDVKRLRFKMPRTYGEFDLGVFAVHVVYVNANNEPDMYLVTDAERGVDEITFSWLVGENALKYKGETKFAVHLRRVEGGRVAQRFNTEPTEIKVLEGLDANIPPEAAEKAFDIIAQLIGMLDDKANAQIADINAAGAAQKAAIEAKGKATLETIPEDYKKMVDDVNQLKNTKADAIMDTSARAASHELHAQDGAMHVTLYGKTTETGTGDKSPDNPYTISGVDVATINVGGKNLVNVADIEGTVKNNFYKEVPLGYWIIPDVNYTLSVNIVSSVEPFNASLGVGHSPDGENAYEKDISWALNLKSGRASITFSVPSEIINRYGGYVFMRTPRYEGNISYSCSVSDIQLEIGSTATAYEPYTANVITPPLLPTGSPLMGNGTVDDTIENDVESGFDKQITFDGDESWNAIEGNFFCSITDATMGNNPESASNYLRRETSFALTKGAYILHSGQIRVNIDGITTTAELRTYIAANPLTVYYRSTDYTPKNDLRVCRAVRRWKTVTLDGTQAMNRVANYGDVTRFDIPSLGIKSGTVVKSERFNPITAGAQNTEGMAVHGSNDTLILQIKTSRLSTDDAAGLKTYFETNPDVITYQARTEATYVTDPVEARKPDTLESETVTVTGSGETAVQYPHDTKHYTDSQHDSLARAVEQNTGEISALNEDITKQNEAMVKSVNGTLPDENGNVQVNGGGSADGVYELIETITIDEDTLAISRTATPDGVAFSADDIFLVIFYNSNHDREKWIKLTVQFEGGDKLIAFKSNETGTLAGAQIAKTYREGNYCAIEISGITTNQGYVMINNAVVRSNSYVLSTRKIIGFTVDRDDGFFVGDIIRVYVRKVVS